MIPTILGVNAVVLAGLLFVLWLTSLARRDASIVDPFWGAGFVVVAWLAWSLAGQPTGRPLLIVLLTTVWGVRLSGFLLWRNRGHGEDYRYRSMREHHGARFWWVSWFTVFGLQGVVLWFVALPLQIGIASRGPANGDGVSALGGALDVAGVGLWCLGMWFETVGDWQLVRFKSDPRNRGQVLDRGLWRYTRHPNYFGDFCVWWGLYLVAAANGAAFTALSPLVMSLLLLKVSGVALLEQTIVERRPAYADYIRRTNAFFPGPPR